jgi:hypothetical protein
LELSLTDSDSPATEPNTILVHFHTSDFDHEMSLPSTFVQTLPSVDVEVAADSTVQQIVSDAIEKHARAGNPRWTDRQAEAIVLFGGMGSAGDSYYALGWHLYGVDTAGHLSIYDTTQDAILPDVLRALENGYFGAPPQEPFIVVTLGVGWGGNGAFVADMVQWLGDVAPEVIAGYLATKALDHLSETKQTKLQSLADKWARRKINSPYVLREWIQSKDSWQVSEVSSRLELNDEAARELLLALGYEDAGRGVLELKSSQDALARRDTWIFQETSRFEDAMDDLLDREPAPEGWLKALKRRLRS